MTVTWPKTVAYSLLAVVAVLGMVVIGLGIVVYNLRDAVAGQEEAKQRSVCLTDEYKEFFAGTAQALSAVLEDRDPPEDALARLRRAARVLPDIDELCAQ